MPKMDYSKLLGLMREQGYTQEKMAESIGISRQSMNNKLTGRTLFTAEDINSIIAVLGIKPSKIGTYFFTE